MDLGGFAENKDVLDGTEESYNAFNYCLAESYLGAIWQEDFEAIGEIDSNFVREISYWLNYDGKSSEEIKDAAKKILTGEIITCNKRTFAKAIISNNQIYNARTWLELGSKDMDLLVFYILNNEDDYNFINRITIGNISTKEKVIEILSNIFKQLKKIYDSINDEQKELEFLKRVKKYLYSIKFDKSIGKISIKMIDSENFIRDCVLKK